MLAVGIPLPEDGLDDEVAADDAQVLGLGRVGLGPCAEVDAVVLVQSGLIPTVRCFSPCFAELSASILDASPGLKCSRGWPAFASSAFAFAFASAAGVREVFELKQVPIELYSGAVGDPAAQLEGEGMLDFAPLLELVDGDNGFGLGKFDRALPVRTRTLGLVLLRVSVALVRDDATPLPCSRGARAVPDLPASLRKLCLMREVSPRHTESELSLYWPPSDYHDARPLPAPWIDMMSTQPAEEDILIGDDDEFVDSAFKSAWQQRRERNTIAADEFIEKYKQHLHQRGLGTDGDRRVIVSDGDQNDADDESAQAGVARRAMAALAADERFVVARSHSRWRRRRRLEILGVLWDTAIRSASLASPSKPA